MKVSLKKIHQPAIVFVLLAVAGLAVVRQATIRNFLKSPQPVLEKPSDSQTFPSESSTVEIAPRTPGEIDSTADPSSNKQTVDLESHQAPEKLRNGHEENGHEDEKLEDRHGLEEEEEEEERKQDQPDQAMKWRMGSLVDETGKIPEGAEMRAWLHAKQMPFDQAAWPAQGANPTDQIASINSSGWQWLGPGNIGGRVRAIIVHPLDPQTIWLGSVSGGIWKTTNGGTTWTPLADFMANLAVSSMAIDPTDPNVLYAGTGEGYFNQDSIRGAGVFKTTDGGATWTQLQSTATADWFWVSRLAISPVNNQIILAATRTGIWRSTDGGTTWSRRLTTSSMFDVNFNPTDGNLAIASGDVGAVNYSTDGGVTWSAATGISGDRVEVAYARSAPSIVYASVENGSGRIYKSTDGGQSYTVASTPNHLGNQGWYDNALWVDPTNPDNVVIGGILLYRSTNGGTSFAQFGGLHTDQHIIVESPNFDGSSNKTVYFGNDGGIYRTLDINAGSVTTTELNNNLGITQFYGGAGNLSSGRIIGGTQDNGTLRYTGTTEGWNSMAGGDGGWSASDPNDPNYFYGEFQWLQLHRSSNGGASSQSIYSGITDAVANGPTNFIAPFILDPNNSNTLLAGGANLWRTNNAKGFVPLGWTNIKSTIGSNISAIAVAKGNSDIVWVGHNNGNIYVATNGTSGSPTWTQVDNNSSLPSRRVTRLTVDPTNSNRVYATFAGFSSLADNVWRTDNGGASWTNISNNLPLAPVRSLVVWQDNPNYLYVGTEVGVFASANGGASWSPSNDGPTNCSVDELFWMGNTLLAATHGRGMFSINITPDQPSSLQLSLGTYSADESGGAATVTVVRSGSTAAAASVDYRTSDTAALNDCNVVNGIASARCDYILAMGTLQFAPNETSKTVSIPIINDSYAEGNESFTFTLSNAVGSDLGSPNVATVTINDNEAGNGANPIDGTAFFVRQQYLDFLNREPDAFGYAGWQQIINSCPAGDTTCDRIHVSSSFFRSPEFQERGYFVYRFYPVAFGRKPGYAEFVPDLSKVSGFISDAELEAAKVAFINEFMARPAFVAKFNGLNNTAYVDTLLQTAGITHSGRDFWIAALGNGTRTRAQVLREIAESGEVYNKYFNQAFVVMQYFGFLRREPDAFYLDWIAVLDANPNDFRAMISGFMNSAEYRLRFGP